MPSNAIVKTKSAPKLFKWLLIGFAAVAVASTVRFFFVDMPMPGNDYDGKQYTLTVNNEQANVTSTYRLVSAHSSEAQIKGLSGTKRLDEGKGMLFWYDQMRERCFWMKDMNYALDIIWLDASKKVLYIERNFTPQSYPGTSCTVAQYVIELNTGEANKSGIAVGRVLSF